MESVLLVSLIALMLLIEQQEGHSACRKHVLIVPKGSVEGHLAQPGVTSEKRQS